MPKKSRKRTRKPRAGVTGRPHLLATHQPPDRATNPTIPWLRGMAAMGDQRWEEAVAAIQRFVGMDIRPQDLRMAYQNLAACYLAMEHYDEALVAMDEVDRLAPNDPDALHGRGVIYACAGRVPQAIAAFERFAHHWPDLASQPDTRASLDLFNRIRRGEAPAGTYLVNYLQKQVEDDVEFGDWEVVERKARRMIAADPARSEGHFALGVTCLEQGRYPEALKALEAAHDLKPGHQATLYNLGYVYLKLDEPGQALSWLERALQEKADDLATLHELGVACERLGQREQAVAWWRRALEFDPGYAPAQWRLHEACMGPEPVEPPLSPTGQQLQMWVPLVKARMRQPETYRNGDLTLTFDGGVGFVLEDAGNPNNGTVHAGGPFRVARFAHKQDVLDLMGAVKLLLRMTNVENTRDVAVLVYYHERPIFNWQARFSEGELVESSAHGQFVVNEMPRLFKLRIDSDLSMPYGDPMQGVLIYLGRGGKPGIMVNTLGLEAQDL
jgi:tetratricopeptide (TPR) repeat protein